MTFFFFSSRLQTEPKYFTRLYLGLPGKEDQQHYSNIFFHLFRDDCPRDEHLLLELLSTFPTPSLSQVFHAFGACLGGSGGKTTAKGDFYGIRMAAEGFYPQANVF